MSHTRVFGNPWFGMGPEVTNATIEAADECPSGREQLQQIAEAAVRHR